MMARVEYRFREQAALAKESRAQEFQTTKGPRTTSSRLVSLFPMANGCLVVVADQPMNLFYRVRIKLFFFEVKVSLTSPSAKRIEIRESSRRREYVRVFRRSDVSEIVDEESLN